MKIPFGRLGIAIALLGVWGCDNRGANMPMAGEARHPNGLVVPRPAALTAGEDGERLVFSDTRDTRQPLIVEFALTSEKPPRSATALDSGEAFFRIEEGGSYSGGTEYRLEAWRMDAGRWIFMTAEQQKEGTATAFEIPWAMLRNARIER